jgi:hypothetical protein
MKVAIRRARVDEAEAILDLTQPAVIASLD